MTPPPPSHALPLVHPRPARGWVNDPHAGVWVEGRYHLFAQWNPQSVEHADVHWAHLVSADLLQWEERGPALVPGQEDDAPDRDGCWSGTAVRAGEETVLVYTGFRTDTPLQTICLASSSDGAGTFVKHPGNPVLRAPEFLDLVAFRDPFLWQEDGRWQALVGAGLRDGRGAALRFSSQGLEDLQTWSYEGVFCSTDQLPTAADPQLELGSVWECPQLVLDGERAVLVVSVWADGPRHVVAISGTRDASGFHAGQVRRFDHGPDLYAPALGPDRHGRGRLLWGWSWEARQRDLVGDLWAGVLTLPREARVSAGGRLVVTPAPEVRGLRGEQRQVVAPSTGDALDVGPAFELSCRLLPSSAVRVADGDGRGFELGRGGDGEIYLDRSSSNSQDLPTVPTEEDEPGETYDADGVLALDRGDRFSIPAGASGATEDDGGGTASGAVRVLVDGSVVEVFSAGATLTARAYPGKGGWRNVAIVSGQVADLRLWPLRLPAQRTERDTQLPPQDGGGPRPVALPLP